MRLHLEDAGKYFAFLSERRRFERIPGGEFTVNADMAMADSAKHGCGPFHFTK